MVPARAPYLANLALVHFATGLMNVLCIETSGSPSSLAAIRADSCRVECLYEKQLTLLRRTASEIGPAMKELLDACGWSASDVSLVAASIGPGSFTGLRIGVTAAKMFAYCARANVIGVSTLRTIAHQARLIDVGDVQPDGVRICVASPAERGQVFAARFAMRSGTCLEQLGDIELVEHDTWLAGLKPTDLATGPALANLSVDERKSTRVAPRSIWSPTARAVGELAVVDFREGKRDDLGRLVPEYHRRSAAEERLAGE